MCRSSAHRCHPLPGRARVRPVHPRRRPDGAPHQARHADDGRRCDHRGRPCSATSSRTWSRCGRRRRPALLVLFLMTGLGRRRLPRRLHQDLQAAQPRPARGRQARRPDAPSPSPSRCWPCSSRRPRFRTPASTRHLVRPRHRLDLGFAGAAVGLVLFVIWALLMIAASNGVNLTDGLDGLATGASVMVFAAYVVIGIWQFDQTPAPAQRRRCSATRSRDPLDLAVVAAAALGACFGFLWWNASPAKIFMGDTGSLALGGALAGLAIMTRTELLLVVLGGLFVLDHAVGDHPGRSFKLTGKRVFQMAPLQHHFELRGLGRGHDRHPVLDHRGALRRRSASASSTPSGSSAVTSTRSRPPTAGGPDVRRRRWSGCACWSPGIGLSGFAAADALLRARRPGHRARRRRRSGRAGARRHARRARRRRPARPGRHGRGLAARGRLPDLVVTSPGWPPGRAAAGGGRGGGRPGVGRGRAGLAAAPADRRRALAGRHRHQRQDHDRADARGHPEGGRAAARGRRQRRHARASRPCCTPEPVRRARRRAVELPAALVALGAPLAGAVPQRGARPPRLARLGWRTTPRTRAGSTSAPRSPASTTSPTRRPSSWSRTPTSSRAAGRSASPSASRRRRHARASSTTCWSTARSSSSGATRARSSPRSTTCGRRRRRSPRTTSRTRSPPPALARAYGVPARRRPRRAARRSSRRRTGIARGRRVRRRGLRRRLQGHQPARRGRARCAPSTRGRVDRRRPGQGRRRSTTWSPRHAARLRGVVLLGADRHVIAEALARHAPDVPVVDGRRRHGHWCHGRVVAAAASLARPGRHRAARARLRLHGPCSPTTRARGDAFAAAVRRSRRRPAGGLTAWPRRLGAPAARGRARRLRRRAAARRLGGAARSRPLAGLLPGARRRPSLLLVLGLVMVLLGARAWTSLRDHGILVRDRREQAMWVGDRRCRSTVVAARLPLKAWRALAWPLLLLGVGRAAARARPLGRRRSTATGTGSTSAGSPLQPSEFGQARAGRCGAPTCWRASSSCSTHWQHLLVPLVPVTASSCSPSCSPGATSAPRSS